MNQWIVKFAQKLLLLTALAIVGALLCATMVRFAPGYGIDERDLDFRLSQSSRDAIRSEHQLGGGLLHYYGSYIAGLFHGNLGTSAFLQRPVAGLLKERAPLTARAVLFGLVTAWMAASLLSLLTIRFQTWALEYSATAMTGLLIALPTAVVALLCLYLRAPVFLGIAVILLPKLFRYQHNILAQANAQPFVLAARARGLSSNRILFHHVIPVAWHPLLALFGVSASMALGAAIPLEALSDSPGMGQLAWQAALNRDLPLLTSITLFVTLATVGVNFLAGTLHERRP
ncbi:MAG TPA: ABC transporter permease [Candidatus Acidoferrum sp.]|nr:ABC transporter permease [Candidatus Acidoferrum sp.]